MRVSHSYRKFLAVTEVREELEVLYSIRLPDAPQFFLVRQGLDDRYFELQVRHEKMTKRRYHPTGKYLSREVEREREA